ncbi:dihydrofolate reductase family protein [Lacisediminihabitans profunda]|uniref:Pyrimidine reductase n=1 Tax=Lacisediminihabitans profunda TaxID=2594790 RepID=A0A5C8UX01_9MICO|nr:dihydrofolate reductase family protein [Lacisediminihabitans profunda]TXN32127.1 pyrimidine reductase [Lacisediminihabitans profunda]
MILTRVFPGPGEPIDTDAEDARARLAGLYEPGADRWLRLNLVASVDGSAAGADGTSESLSNRADRKILGVIRRHSQVVLVGAASVRAEGYQLPRTVPLAVLTGSGDLTGHRLEPELAPDRLIVLCPASAEPAVHESLGGIAARIVTIPDLDGRLAATSVVGSLAALGFNRIVCEGGPTLAAQLLDAGLVDELCLSTSPRIGAGRLRLLGDRPIEERPLELRQLLVDDGGGLYARWLLRGS